MKPKNAARHRLLLGVSALLLAGAVLLALASMRPTEARKTFFAMDTHIAMTAFGRQPESALEEAAALIQELESLWSVTEETSDIYAVNHSGGETVLAPEGKLCDALSTALFVMGPETAAEFWLQDPSFEMLLITEDGEILLTEGAAERFSLDSYHANMAVHILS